TSGSSAAPASPSPCSLRSARAATSCSTARASPWPASGSAAARSRRSTCARVDRGGGSPASPPSPGGRRHVLVDGALPGRGVADREVEVAGGGPVPDPPVVEAGEGSGVLGDEAGVELDPPDVVVAVVVVPQGAGQVAGAAVGLQVAGGGPDGLVGVVDVAL